jgi:hypothetical protein
MRGWRAALNLDFRLETGGLDRDLGARTPADAGQFSFAIRLRRQKCFLETQNQPPVKIKYPNLIYEGGFKIGKEEREKRYGVV